MESELGGRVAMEAGPRNTDQGTQDPQDEAPRLSPDGPDEDAVTPEVEVELRPQRRLRIWQLAPIVMLAAIGSLMFAFPLAFGTGDGGAVVAMLGLLISCCAAGWGMMAARRVGHTWPGLPARGSGERPDWRVLALYVAGGAALVALAVWRVARLR
ncbi:membrane protein [Streptomyces camponoticapitis]|uniref:Membrane protein n=2 Tax=Streptomyces camponoticapitis TaxID=1616125 RepID=A0ABQ2ECB9_9ACTN|nr:membrane protein [Streptomyces camponoticapitis]